MRFARCFGLVPLPFLLAQSCGDGGQLLASRTGGPSAGSPGSGGIAGASSGSSGRATGGTTMAGAGTSGGSSGASTTGGSAGSLSSGGTAGTGTGAAAGAGGGEVAGTGGAGAPGGRGGSGGGVAQAGDSGVAGAEVAGAGGATTHPCGPSSACDSSPTNCCAPCGDSVISQWSAIADEDYATYIQDNCQVPCPACVGVQQPSFAAVCRDGDCTAVDLKDDELSQCSVDDDCRLRWGSGCCEGCDATANASALVAVSKTANITAALCGTKLPPCCGPAGYPSSLKAACDAGHCRVVSITP